MTIPLFKKLHFAGSMLMVCGLVYSGLAQEVMFLLGSLLVLASLFMRMYLIHMLFHIPFRYSVMNYVLIPMVAFLGIAIVLNYQPENVSYGMWCYLLGWTGAVLGVSVFFHTISRRLLALPWRNQGHK